MFALTIERTPLLHALAGALQAVESKSTIPILGNFLLRATADTLVVTGTNLDMEATARVPADVTREGAITVQARALHDIAKKLPAEARIAIASEGGGRATVSCGRARFQIPTLPEGDFPEFTMGEFAYRIEVAGSILANMLSRAHSSISTEETRYYLNGIYTHVVEVEGVRTLRMVATTGHKLARLDTTRATGLDPAMPGVIIPRGAVAPIQKLATDAGAEDVELEISERLVRASLGNTTIVSKVIDGTFPDYARVIPTTFARTATAPTLELIAAVDRVATISGEKTKGVKLDFGADSVRITVRNADDGSAGTDELDITLDGPPIEIGFNAKYLGEILAQAGSDVVRINLGADAGAPAVIGDKLAEGLFVLMPLRT